MSAELELTILMPCLNEEKTIAPCIEEALGYLREGAEVVIGNRFAAPPNPQAISVSHRLGVPFLSWLVRMRLGCDVQEFHCGLRGVRADALARMHFSCGGMEFATEMIAAACRAHLAIAQTTVKLRPDGRQGPSHLRPLRDGLRHLRLIARG